MSEMAETQIVCTCHTEGCSNADVPIVMMWLGDSEPYVMCGVCSQRITDISDEAVTPHSEDEKA